jgi:hypothetical protein
VGAERLDDSYTVCDAPFVERFDAVDADRGVKMLVVAPPAALRRILRRLLQVQFESVQLADGVDPSPGSPNAKPSLE